MTTSTDGVGSVSEEASRLFAAFESWVQNAKGGAGVAFSAADSHIATGTAECQLCPVCRLIALMRGTRPEVFEHLVDATSSMLAAMRAAIDAHEHGWASRNRSPVEHIDIG